MNRVSQAIRMLSPDQIPVANIRADHLGQIESALGPGEQDLPVAVCASIETTLRLDRRQLVPEDPFFLISGHRQFHRAKDSGSKFIMAAILAADKVSAMRAWLVLHPDQLRALEFARRGWPDLTDQELREMFSLARTRRATLPKRHGEIG